MSRTIYVPLADVAAACGVSAYRLQNRLLPAHWATPRDYLLLPPRYTCLLAEASLPELVDALRAEGLPAEAARLEEWRAAIATGESHEEFSARHAASGRGAGVPWWQKGQFA